MFAFYGQDGALLLDAPNRTEEDDVLWDVLLPIQLQHPLIDTVTEGMFLFCSLLATTR